MRVKTGNPPELFDSVQYGFSQAVRARGGHIVNLSGQVAWDGERNLVGSDSLLAQTSAALDNVARALASVGAAMEDVVSLRIYIVDFANEPSAQVTQALVRHFSTSEPPAATWVGVTALAHPDLKVEIEATAVVDTGE